MATAAEVNNLIVRLKNDDADYEGSDPHSWGLNDYLKTVLEDDNFTDDAAIGSAKRAIADGISSVTDNQLKAIALDMLNNYVYMPKCPNAWCGEKIAWGDMGIALNDEQCYHCRLREEKIKSE